jgi:hypothetical protein
MRYGYELYNLLDIDFGWFLARRRQHLTQKVHFKGLSRMNCNHVLDCTFELLLAGFVGDHVLQNWVKKFVDQGAVVKQTLDELLLLLLSQVIEHLFSIDNFGGGMHVEFGKLGVQSSFQLFLW